MQDDQNSGSLWIACPERPDPTAILPILHLDPNAIGIGEVQFLCVAAQSDGRFDAFSCELSLDDICIEPVNAKANMINPWLNAGISWIQADESSSYGEIHPWRLSREDRHAEQALIELL